ncbi:MAG: FadR/GntR family transcriptional regulator [Thermomicrobiales bacterium]
MSASRFAPVTVTRSYEQVVQQIQDQITSGQLVRGQKLPAERELEQQFGVSRRVVREAVKVLGTMGLVESRHGSGVYVRNNPLPVVSQALTLSITPDEQSIERVFEFRLPLEVMAARWAARRRTEPQLAAIREAAALSLAGAESGAFQDFITGDLAFHAAIGQASANPYLRVILSVLEHLLSEINRRLERSPGSILTASRQHVRIAEAIAAGRADEAGAAMAEHVRYAAHAAQIVLDLDDDIGLDANEDPA